MVHVKEDLRFALHLARAAEKTAKRLPNKDALALTVCRRSGEHTAAGLGWGQIEGLHGLVEWFAGGASDRWAYKVRGELHALSGGLPWLALSGEVRRLVNRSEGGDGAAVEAFLSDYHAEMAGRRDQEGSAVLADFVTLCQSAAFLARGG